MPEESANLVGEKAQCSPSDSANDPFCARLGHLPNDLGAGPTAVTQITQGLG